MIDMTDYQRKLIEDNHNIIYMILKKNHLSIDDWYDIAAIGMCKAAISYKPDKDVRFTTYAAKCIQNAISVEYKTSNYQKRAGDNELVYYDSMTNSDDGDESALLNMFASNVNVEQEAIDRVILDNIMNVLDGRRTIVFNMLMAGYKLREISEKMGVSHNMIFLHKKQIAKKIKENALC